jgi:hypothetical protein
MNVFNFRFTCVILIFALLFLPLFGCSEEMDNDKQKDIPPAVSDANNIADGASDIDISRLGYDKYFSEERIWKEEASKDYDGYTYYTDKNDGYIYRNRIEAPPGEQGEIFLAEPVGKDQNFTIVNGDVICIIDEVIGKEVNKGCIIIQYNIDSQTRRTLFHSDGVYEDIRANSELIYFRRDGVVIARLHRSSMRYEELFASETIGEYYPLSNYALHWQTDNAGYIFNIYTGTNRAVSSTDYDESDRFVYKIPESYPDVSGMSYDEYFSTERLIRNESSKYGYTQKFEDDSGYSYYIDEDDGYLYRRKLDAAEDTAGELVLSASVGESAEDMIMVNGYLICIIDGKTVERMNYDGTGRTTLYTSDGVIDMLRVTPGLVYFRENSCAIRRMHILSRRVDTMVTAEAIDYYELCSNYSVRWDVFTKEYLDFMASDINGEDIPKDIVRGYSYLHDERDKADRLIDFSIFGMHGFAYFLKA